MPAAAVVCTLTCSMCDSTMSLHKLNSALASSLAMSLLHFSFTAPTFQGNGLRQALPTCLHTCLPARFRPDHMCGVTLQVCSSARLH